MIAIVPKLPFHAVALLCCHRPHTVTFLTCVINGGHGGHDPSLRQHIPARVFGPQIGITGVAAIYVDYIVGHGSVFEILT